MNNLADYQITDSYGGGLYAHGEGEPILRNCVVANNAASSSSDGPDIYGAVQSADFNLIEVEAGATVNGATSNNITGQDPVLGGLAENDGSTWTHALLTGSPALDAGSCEDGEGGQVTSDQRGKPRPQGYGCDIGAYEAQAELTLHKEVNQSLPRPGERITYTITVENGGIVDAPGAAISDTLPSDLSLAGTVMLEPGSAGTLDVSSSLIRVTDLTVPSEGQVAVTIPVTVSASISSPKTIVNIVTMEINGVEFQTASRSIRVVNETHSVYLPLAMSK